MNYPLCPGVQCLELDSYCKPLVGGIDRNVRICSLAFISIDILVFTLKFVTPYIVIENIFSNLRHQKQFM